MGHIQVALMIPPEKLTDASACVTYICERMWPYEGEGNKTDGWEVVEFITWIEILTTGWVPSAYITPDGLWHDMPEGMSQEEREWFKTRARMYMGRQHLDKDMLDTIVNLWEGTHPYPETPWSREWRALLQQYETHWIARLHCHR